MSDKFFFNGSQDARQDHVGSAYQTNAGSNVGSKKYPLPLVDPDSAAATAPLLSFATLLVSTYLKVNTPSSSEALPMVFFSSR